MLRADTGMLHEDSHRFMHGKDNVQCNLYREVRRSEGVNRGLNRASYKGRWRE